MRKCDEEAASYLKNMDTFKSDDAKSLLAGDISKIDKTIRKKYQATYNWNRKGGTILFNMWAYSPAEKRRGLDVESQILELIKEEHDKHGTFVIRVRTPKQKSAGFDIAAHKKKQLAKAAAANAKLKEDAEAEASDAAMMALRESLKSGEGSRPGTSSVMSRFGFSSRPSTRQNDEAEDRTNFEREILSNEKIQNAIKLLKQP